MIVLKSRKLIPLVLSFVLLLAVAVPYGPGKANAAKGSDIATGWQHSLVLKSDGTIVAWGYNYNGQTNVPAGLAGVAAVAAGSEHSLALKSDGTVVAWGGNSQGQTNVPAGLSGVVAISAGYSHSLALKSDGTVVAWGGNSQGQTNVPVGLSGVAAISAGGYHSLALKTDGTVVAWGATGYNNHGQTNVPAGLAGVAAIAAGVNHSLALKTDGTVVAWGYNFYGQGNVPAGLSGVTAIAAGEYHSLALKSDGTVVGWGDNTFGQATAPAGLDGVAEIEVGIRNSLVLRTDGTVVIWGSNAYGQLNMPGNDSLSGLTVQGGALNPAFSPSVTAYTYYIDSSISSVNITATLADAANAELYVDNHPQTSGTVATVSASGASTVIPIRVEPSLKPPRTYTITVYRGDAPEIQLIGPNPMTVEANSPFVDPGATAHDAQGGDISNSIMVTGTVDTSTLGTYMLSYNVSDAVGFTAPTVTRTVYVQDTQPPVLTLLGNSVMSVPFGATFADPGAQATDAHYGDVSPLLVVTGTVDTSKAGEYTLRYNVTDPSGNAAAEATRMVTVRAPEDPDSSVEPSDGSADIFQVSVKINGAVKRVGASYETTGGQRVTWIFPTAEQLSEAFATEPDGIRIEAQDIGDSVKMDLPAAPLLHAVELRPAARLEWSVNGNGLRIPLHILQGAPEEGTVTFMIAEAAGFVVGDWNEPIARVGGESLLLHPVVYTLQAKHGDSIDWAPTYAILTAVLPEPANPDQATAVRIDENGRMRFAPSVFSNDGSPLATIRSPYDGAYSVIRSDHSFADVNGHWAQKDIVLMANKLLVEGRAQDRFVPEDRITRAEFAAMLVRALGLDDEPDGRAPFRDVAPGPWYAGAVRAAQQHQLVAGFEDGTFRPEAPITREQMAVMIVGAMEYAGFAPVADGTPKTFDDAADIAPWADAAVGRLTGASIIRGLTGTTFGPREYASRAQSADLLKRMLQAMQFINS